MKLREEVVMARREQKNAEQALIAARARHEAEEVRRREGGREGRRKEGGTEGGREGGQGDAGEAVVLARQEQKKGET